MTSELSTCSYSKPQIKLMKFGKWLSLPPSSTVELLNVLMQIERLLSEVKESPSEQMNNAMDPLIEALIAKELLKHPDIDVNILVARCICEIMRINVPKILYNDEQMKDFFELVVITFEKLSSECGGCYTKMTKVLKMLSEFKLSVLMLDLDGHELIIRLFNQFLTVADSNSVDIVFEMEEIMTMIIEESEDFKIELQGLVAKHAIKDIQSSSPVCWQLGEKVLVNCEAQHMPDVPNMGRDMSIALYDYIKLVEHVSKVSPEKDITESKKIPSKFVREVKGKRKRTSQWKKQDSSIEHGKDLVGTKIKVWWPEDKTYYSGVVKFFDCEKKRHGILYDDGDEELVDLKEERWLMLEIVNAIPDSFEHTPLTNISSSQSDTICINGYNVKKNLAPILESIFKKHGDITTNCVFKTDSMKASFLEFVCEVVKQIQTNDDIIKMEEIESQLLAAETANVNISWLRAELKMKEKRISAKQAAQVGLEERLCGACDCTRSVCKKLI